MIYQTTTGKSAANSLHPVMPRKRAVQTEKGFTLTRLLKVFCSKV